MGSQYWFTSAFLSAYILYTGSVCGGHWVDSRATFNEPNIMIQKGTQTHYGKEFVVGFINPPRSQEETGKCEIFINTLENNTKLRVHIPYSSVNQKYVLRKKEVIRVDIPKEVLMARETKVEMKGVGITANKDIVVYAFSKVNVSSGYEGFKGDGFLVFPRRSLGFEYVASTYTGSQSNLGVVGVQNNTNVSIVFKAHSGITYRDHVYRSGDTLNITLNGLQTFHISSREDLSGLRVIADKPVAVLSGASCELSKVASNCGNVLDQLPAVKTWDKKYTVYSGRSNSTDGGLVRVTSASKNTVVLMEDGRTARLGIGDVMDLVVKSRLPTLISCTPYCMTTLYNTHPSLDRCSESIHPSKGCHVGPSMTILPGTKQFLPYYSVYVSKEGNKFSFFSIVIKCSAANGLVINDIIQRNLAWESSRSETWCGVTVQVRKHGVNTLYHKDSNATFSVIVTATGDEGSYAYIAGRSFNVVQNNPVSLQETKPTLRASSNSINLKNVWNTDALAYKFATIALSVLCGILLLLLSVLLLRYRTKHPKSVPEENTTMNTKPITEREYQSIRGLPRRDTHSYEEVKLPPKLNSRLAITKLLPPSPSCKDYENLQVQKNRDSNPYLPMDEAWPGTAVAEQLSSMPEDEDVYLTMKKLVQKSQDTEEGTAEVQE